MGVSLILATSADRRSVDVFNLTGCDQLATLYPP